ncbi:MAG TPA: TonB-dependent receptor, partial [Myxococcota bacterium]|nr:TonB-dependent receptor [Myxococcota bacterium]
GGKVGEDAAYRVYSKGFDRQAYPSPDGDGRSDAGDDWSQQRAGFRFDWAPTARDSLTVHGDYYRGDLDNRSVYESGTFGANGGYLLANWSRELSETSQIRLQAYYDGMKRGDPLADERRHTGDLEFQHDIQLWDRHQIAWGLNYRIVNDRIDGRLMNFRDPSETFDTIGFFVQDQISLFANRVQLTLGSKFERNDFTGFEIQPSARLAYSPNEHHTLWAAVSRAVRTPSRAEDDMRLRLLLLPPAAAEITGVDEFHSEEMLAYEAGYRSTLRSNLTLDTTAFYFDYDELSSIETGVLYFDGIQPILPLPFSNQQGGHSYGAELEVTWQALPRWRLGAGYSWFNLMLDPGPDSVDLLGETTEHSNPTHQVFLRSLVDLPRNFELDGMLYYVENLAGQSNGGDPVGSYVRADLRLGWRPTEALELSLVGQNLLTSRHEEFGGGVVTSAVVVPRSFFAKLTWRY